MLAVLLLRLKAPTDGLLTTTNSRSPSSFPPEILLLWWIGRPTPLPSVVPVLVVDAEW